jgi:hypothetical protein
MVFVSRKLSSCPGTKMVSQMRVSMCSYIPAAQQCRGVVRANRVSAAACYGSPCCLDYTVNVGMGEAMGDCEARQQVTWRVFRSDDRPYTDPVLPSVPVKVFILRIR